MREKQSDYFENSRRAAHVQREYAERNPREFAGYDANCWGFSACDGPPDRLGYTARGVPYGPDDGTISGVAALATLPFAPEIALQAVRTMIARHPQIVNEGRLASSFNPSVVSVAGRSWVSTGHYGLDQGLVVMMIENHRSQLIWQMMRDCPCVIRGLRRAGFAGGWL